MSYLQLSLELHACFDHLQGVCEQPRPTRRKSSHQKLCCVVSVHHQEALSYPAVSGQTSLLLLNLPVNSYERLQMVA